MRLPLKKYPADYTPEVLQVIKAMSFTEGKRVKLVGSFTLRNQVYAGDVDGLEFVPVRSISALVNKFKDVVRRVMALPTTYISDIKCGSVEEWKVIPDTATIKEGRVVGYDATKIKAKVKKLYDTNVIDESEYTYANRLLKSNPNAVEFLAIRRELRYNILRWTPKEVIKGYKILQDGRKYTLEMGVVAPTITKMDVVSWVNGNRFTDFEMIYEFHKGKAVLNKGLADMDIAIRENILVLRREGNYFKMAKRMFALARYYKWKHDLKPLSELFNIDLGRLNSIYGDAEALNFIIEEAENIPKDKVLSEAQQFVGRLANVTIPTYMRREPKIMRIVRRLQDPKLYTADNETMLSLLDKLRGEIYEILQNYTLRYLREQRLYPLATKYLP